MSSHSKACIEYNELRDKDSKESRIKAFNDLKPQAVKELLEQGYKIQPEILQDYQITLALQSGIVPPRWTGYCYCDKCGCVAAESCVTGTKTSSCSFCLVDFVPIDTDPRIVGIRNRLASYIQIVRDNLPPEIDI
jgi:hypothetical protein